MYDNGYVRLTALRRDTIPFSPMLRIGLNYLALFQGCFSIVNGYFPDTWFGVFHE